jgi:hypothetical protein|tara:strand:- start:85 stop:567 length:483 start_codon:yes stop_codon:yes gene_type:complete
MKKIKPNWLTIIIRGIILIISFSFIIVLHEYSKLIVPPSMVTGFIRATISTGIMIGVWKLVSHIHIPIPKPLSIIQKIKGLPLGSIIQKIKGLPLGWYRLSLLLWFLTPFILFFFVLSIGGNDAGAFFMFFIGIIFYWPLHFLVMWVVDGFLKENSGKNP